MRPSVQVVYVNYRSAAWLGASVASLRVDAATIDVDVDITVVDNSCDAVERERLEATLPTGIRTLAPTENLGFARASNLGSRSGRDRAPFVLFVNPDTLWPRGAFARFVDVVVARGDHALVGPRHFADPELRYAHAPMRGASLFDETWDLAFVHGWDPRRPLRYLRDRDRLAERSGPVRVRTLSGGCLGTSRRVFDALGGFDESFWMYGEDVELSVRARRRGIDVEYWPELSIVHVMEASARLLPDRVAASRVEGRTRFKRARYGTGIARLERAVHARAARWLPRRDDPWARAEPGLPRTLARPDGATRWAVEIARSPLFDNCLTRFCDAPAVDAPVMLIDELPAGRYFVRTAGRARGTNRWRDDRLFSVDVDDTAAPAAPSHPTTASLAATATPSTTTTPRPLVATPSEGAS